jgi:hypothetical protein
MKIFGREFFGKAPEPQPLTQTTTSSYSSFAFSTPLFEIGDGNLSAPYVNKYYTQNNIVRFGSDNLYPQTLVQLYLQSAMLGICVDFTTNSVIGGGYEWVDENTTANQKIDELAFEKMNKTQKLAKLLVRDYIIHNRVTVVINKKSNIVKLKRLDPSTIRHSADLKTFIYSYDWSRGMVAIKEYKRWEDGCGDGEYLYVYQDETPGQDVYAIPRYNSILNWAFLDGEQAFFHKSNIQNSVFPSIVIRRPKDFQNAEEIAKFKDEISSKTGAKNAGRVMVLTGNGMDDVPEVVTISANNNDKLFESTSKEIKENISIAMGLNPSIMGVKTAGQLGNTEEIKTSFAIFEKNVVMPLREECEAFLNELFHICPLVKNSIKITNYRLIDDEIKPVAEPDMFFYRKNKQ